MNEKSKIFQMIVFYIGLCIVIPVAHGQTNPYHETPTKINDLVNTKLDVRFDYQHQYLNGKEWVTLKPHFYPTDSLELDAKGMDIHNVSIFKNDKKIPVSYSYNNAILSIQLDRMYHHNENYTVYIDYTAKPNELKNRAKNEKGLYFINPEGKDKNKPIQIWTEGEPESSSLWFPTIDKPNQKTTAEISMTVPAKYVTLSNGALISKKNHTDGTRTDTWKLGLPQSPYLFMMAVGDFTIYKDNWNGKEVSYYLEPAYAPYAKEIFGETPEAIDFFSKKLGVAYPWNKYSQIVVRDYVSGAMENTTATVMGEPAQGTTKELADRYDNTGIAHELFHQWFGDYVTTESWSNLTLNESMAVFGEIIWLEHKYGKDVADAHNLEGMQAYLSNPNAKNEALVRYNYNKISDVFDGVTYQKGGSILYMLRSFLGDAAFYKGLNIYLTTNALKNAEAHDLRLAFEQASGLDLNWFFNEWYFGAGNPELAISYSWNEQTKTQSIYLSQTQDGNMFVLPFAIDFYINGKVETHNVWMKDKTDTFTFHLPTKPDLVNVDADKALIVKKKDNKPLSEFAFQYFNAPLYVDRYEALEAAMQKQNEPDAQKIMLAALKDKYFGIRIKTINAIDLSSVNISTYAIPLIKELAINDKNNLVKEAAITTLGKLKQPNYLSLFEQTLKTESYAVQGASLIAISEINPSEALQLAKHFESDNKKQVSNAILAIYTNDGEDEQWNYIYRLYQSLVPPKRFNIIKEFTNLTARVKSPDYVKQGIAAIKELGIAGKHFGIADTIIELLNKIKETRVTLHNDNSAKLINDAINEINNAQ